MFLQELQESTDLGQILVGLVGDGQLEPAQKFAASLPLSYRLGFVRDCDTCGRLKEAVDSVKLFKLQKVSMIHQAVLVRAECIAFGQQPELNVASKILHQNWFVTSAQLCVLSLQQFPGIEDRYRQHCLTKLLDKEKWSLALTFAGQDTSFQVLLCLCCTVVPDVPLFCL